MAAGEEILITRGRQPIARLVPVSDPGPRELGTDPGPMVPEDFDDPLPDELLNAYER